MKNFELEEFSTDKNSLKNNSKMPGYKYLNKMNSLNTTNAKVNNLTASHSNSVIIKSPKEIHTVKKNKFSLCCNINILI